MVGMVRAMKLDAVITGDLTTAEEESRLKEEQGFAGVWAAESGHDPFLPLVLAERATTTADLGTAIAVAFARNPMSTAIVANELHATSGRFILGLGSQVRAHITRRFSMEWSRPAARMREFILALHATWSSWNDGTKLDFQGDFYTHTLMPAYFAPPPNPHGRPGVYLAGVGVKMTEVAGEVADGFLTHPFSTERYLRNVTIPALEAGAARAGRSLDDIVISAPGFVVTGRDDAEMAVAAAAVRQQVAFYGSTPGYRDVLEQHGWGDLQEEANRMVRAGRVDELGDLVDDEVLGAFAVVAEPDKLSGRLEERYGDVAGRVNIDAPYEAAPEVWRTVAGGRSD